MRLDKYLKVSRLIKRRPVANEACDAGRILVNDKVAKASLNVKPGDVIEIQFGNRNRYSVSRKPIIKTRQKNCTVFCDGSGGRTLYAPVIICPRQHIM